MFLAALQGCSHISTFKGLKTNPPQDAAHKMNSASNPLLIDEEDIGCENQPSVNRSVELYTICITVPVFHSGTAAPSLVSNQLPTVTHRRPFGFTPIYTEVLETLVTLAFLTPELTNDLSSSPVTSKCELASG